MTFILNSFSRFKRHFSNLDPRKKRIIFVSCFASLVLILTLFSFLLWPGWHKNQAITLVNSKMTIEELETIVAREPENKEALKLLGNDYYAAFKYDQAIDIFKKEIALDTKDAQSISTLASAYRDKGESSGDKIQKENLINQAKSTFSQAIDTNQNFIKAYLDYADLLNSLNDQAGALAVLDQGLTANSGNDKLVKLKEIIAGS